MVSAAGQAILHATVAALLVEFCCGCGGWTTRRAPGAALGGYRRARAPHDLYLALAPWRASSWFVEHWSLFAGSHWDHLRAGGVGVASGVERGVLIRRPRPVSSRRRAVVADRLVRTMPEDRPPRRSPRLRTGPRRPGSADGPRAASATTLTVVALGSPVLLCTGIDRTAIVISTGTLDRLDDDALQAALAHESRTSPGAIR